MTDTPAGLVLRPDADESDVAAIVELMNAEWAADDVPWRASLANKQAEYRHPSEIFDPRRDVTLAEVDGVPVGYAVRGWLDVVDSFARRYRVDGSVHPDWRRRGIGRALLAENMRRAADLAAQHSTERQLVYSSLSHDGQAGAFALLTGAGFEPARWFFDMTRHDLDDIELAPVPDGLHISPVDRQAARQVWEADVESFRDHWGGYDDSDESFRRFADSPSSDPSMWVIAFDGDTIAGGVICAIHEEENKALGVERGWLDSVFTRRPWRKRGLARALIGRGLLRLRERGMSSAVLNVDAANATGALGLYERAGFEVSHRSTVWRRPLDINGGRR
jgi:mycothiol synthase